ncbi:class II glutamine amidotransferase [Vibrio sp. S9_S30]|uniref:class II glutamine amidotransferase n=1 Tax=Vibrio sp. S9_S30 TaxID=2720226 RepID=UPI0016800F7D|nr:class II glutamine amidotransferase [Vibrio sp. S9_S30]MBD1558208.1 class II glutamine amidotransferase [Vibrio sp. S9_S30]
MCRWLAYQGKETYLSDLIFAPEYSLVQQSMSARKSITAINADGFGVGWYGVKEDPGLYREVLPAWSDCNLKSLSEHIVSPLFFAHVRASTGTQTARTNCHPFRYKNWLFMHNGQIGGYAELRWHIERLIPKSIYGFRQGQTDSELLFLLLIANGLVEGEPSAAIGKTLELIESLMLDEKIEEPLRISASWSDGETIWAFRYASDDHAPTLFYKMMEKGIVVASEPLDSERQAWYSVDQARLMTVHKQKVAIKELNH